MTLTQLGYLVAIVEHGFNISKAASTLHTSQPGVSRQIKLLEVELGINILTRRGGRIVGLTEHGQRVAEAAKVIVKEAGRLKSMRDEILGHGAGELRVATLHSIAMTVLPMAVLAMRNDFPSVTIDVQQASAAHCFELLGAGEIDLALTIEVPLTSHHLATLPMGSVGHVLLVPDGHPLLNKKTVTLEDIASHPLVFSRATGSNWGVTRVFVKHGIELKPSIYVMDVSVIKSFVQAGAGISIVSRASYDEKQDRNVRAIDISHMFAPSQLSIVFDPFRYMRSFAYRFIESLAPAWTPHKVLQEIRSHVYTDGTEKRG